MKLRWPIRPLDESLVSSLISSFVPPPRPATQASLSFSRLSSNNLATLTCGMRLPFRDQLMQLHGALGAEQPLAEGFVTEHLRELGQDLQVQVRGAIRDQQREDQIDVLAIRRVKRDRLLHPDQRADRFLETLDP